MTRCPALRSLLLIPALLLTASIVLAADEVPDTTGMTRLQRLIWQAKQMNREAGIEEPSQAAALELPPGVRRLTTTPGDEGVSAWSPDGASIYYEYREGKVAEIRRLDLADNKTETVSMPMESTGSPHISPNGKFMTFVRGIPSQGRKVFVMRLEDGEQAKLTPTMERGEEADPVWSRSGAKIYLSVHNRGVPFYDPYEITRDGERFKSLLDGHELPGSSYQRPAPSPDGKRVAWCLRRGRSCTIKIINTRIAALSEEHEIPGVFFGMADWLPDGKTMVVSYLLLDDPRAGYSLGFVDLETDQLTPWLDLSSTDGNVRVSPDGKQATFTAKSQGHSELFLADLP